MIGGTWNTVDYSTDPGRAHPTAHFSTKMGRIEQDIKLDFKDVLIRPKRSTLKSRSQVELDRSLTFKHSRQQWTGIPIMAANMDTTGESCCCGCCVLSRRTQLTPFFFFVFSSLPQAPLTLPPSLPSTT